MRIPSSQFQSLETPCYFYDLDLLHQTCEAAQKQSSKFGYHIHYAVKANYNDRILGITRDYSFGADCVSGNEVLKSIEVGFNKADIVFAGVGKTDKEIEVGLNSEIFGFNCESYQEIEVINEIAGGLSKTANISLRINPNVDAKTHHHITTGLEENKFGINVWELDDVLELVHRSKNLKLIGIHFHIGSQVTDLSRYVELCHRVNDIQKIFDDKGIALPHLNVGGGLGIDYVNPIAHPIVDFESFFKVFNQNLEVRHGQEVHFELGRAIVGQCGLLITKVLYEKVGKKKHFLILDAGMTELMRPALYQAEHLITNLSAQHEEHQQVYDVVGPICETTDAFARDLKLPKSKRGDLMAIHSAGAYGQVLSNKYNLRDDVRVVYSDEI
ncbi:MAG: diaminopimelate decarboxylase [Cyclobacteriaceae bacterium]